MTSASIGHRGMMCSSQGIKRGETQDLRQTKVGTPTPKRIEITPAFRKIDKKIKLSEFDEGEHQHSENQRRVPIVFQIMKGEPLAHGRWNGNIQP